MTNRRIHDLDDTATTLDSGAYIAVDSDSYTAAKKFAADKLPDPTGATDGYVWTADGADGAAWEAVSGGASDVTDLTTTTGSSTNMVRVAAAGGLEYRTVAQVLSDIGALAATGSVTGATSSAQTFTNGIIGPTWKPASDSTSALQLQTSAGTAVVTVDTTNSNLSIVNHLGVDTTASNDIGIAVDSTVNVPTGSIVAGLSGSMLLNGVGSGLDTFAGMSFAPRTLVSVNNITHMVGVSTKLRVDHTGGTVVNAYGFRMEEPSHASAGTVTTAYGLKLGSMSIGATNYAIYTDAGHVRFGDRLTVIQDSATAAVPVLTLQQDDDSEDMIEFTGTVGTGNAIEAVGAKTLTTTHFIKCTITGVGNVYIPVGTIA